eukprot:g29564.t1
MQFRKKKKKKKKKSKKKKAPVELEVEDGDAEVPDLQDLQDLPTLEELQAEPLEDGDVDAENVREGMALWAPTLFILLPGVTTAVVGTVRVATRRGAVPAELDPSTGAGEAIRHGAKPGSTPAPVLSRCCFCLRGAVAEASDARRGEAARLQEMLPSADAAEGVQIAKRILQLLDEEGIADLTLRGLACSEAVRHCQRLGDLQRAQSWAKQAYIFYSQAGPQVQSRLL